MIQIPLNVQEPMLEDDGTLKQMRINLPSVVLACDYTGVSDKSAATITSAILQDLRIIGPKDKSFVVNRSKIRYEHSKMWFKLQNTIYSEELVSH